MLIQQHSCSPHPPIGAWQRYVGFKCALSANEDILFVEAAHSVQVVTSLLWKK